MTTTKIGLSYLRLSDDDIGGGESSSIANQRRIINDYCKQNNITLIKEFVDDGWSGGNFERPGFQQMMRELQNGKANIVITKDLSRLGRDMRESSYYAEQFFPEHGIRYIALSDNFDSEKDNVLAPFQFAMNEVYLRDGSKKIKEVLKNKRENGLYCACPPFGYKKDEYNKNILTPDENTAYIVKKIFYLASKGLSCQKIAETLDADRDITPLKYRLIRDTFCEKGAERATDKWCRITVRRILNNEVYLGHTVLGRTKKASLKSKKKINVEKENWSITRNTHEPLVSEMTFDMAKKNLGRNRKRYEQYDQVRRNIFSGIVFCEKCGHAMCTGGSVYKGERKKYWYLGCSHMRSDVREKCSGARILYEDLCNIVKNDINNFLSLNESDLKKVTDEIMEIKFGEESLNSKTKQIEAARNRLCVIDKIISKLYVDNANGKIGDERFYAMLSELEKESCSLKKIIEESSCHMEDVSLFRKNFDRFFEITKQYTHIEELTRDIVLHFVDRIEIGAKVFPEGVIRNTHRNQPFSQEIKIYYKFIGNIDEENTRNFNV